jgi:hypothetical protein
LASRILRLRSRVALARVEVADELHGQRRAALDVVAGLEVLDRRADDALEVDARVLVEARSSTATVALRMFSGISVDGTGRRSSLAPMNPSRWPSAA